MKIPKNLHRYLSNTSWMMFEKGVAMGMVLLINIFVARYLGREQFGLLSFSKSFVELFAFIVGLGLDGILQRELIKNKGNRDILLGTSFTLSLCAVVVVYALLGIGLLFIESNTLVVSLIFMMAAGVWFRPLDVIRYYFESRVESKLVVFSNLFATGVDAGFRLLLIFAFHASLIWFATANLVQMMLLFSGLAYCYWRSGLSIFNWKFDPQCAKRLLRDSWPVIFSTALIMIYMRIDQIMLREMVGEGEVGLYAAAVKLSEPWYVVSLVIMNSIFPAIISSREHGLSIYHRRLQMLHDLLFALALGIALIISPLAGFIIHLLYGAGFSGSAGILALQIWTGIFVFHRMPLAKYLIAENKQYVSVWYNFAGMLSNVLLNYFLIPSYGGVGAAWATLISYSVPIFVISLFFPSLRDIMKIRFKSYLLPLRLLIYKKNLYQDTSNAHQP